MSQIMEIMIISKNCVIKWSVPDEYGPLVTNVSLQILGVFVVVRWGLQSLR